MSGAQWSPGRLRELADYVEDGVWDGEIADALRAFAQLREAVEAWVNRCPHTFYAEASPRECVYCCWAQDALDAGRGA